MPSQIVHYLSIIVCIIIITRWSSRWSSFKIRIAGKFVASFHSSQFDSKFDGKTIFPAISQVLWSQCHHHHCDQLHRHCHHPHHLISSSYCRHDHHQHDNYLAKTCSFITVIVHCIKAVTIQFPTGSRFSTWILLFSQCTVEPASTWLLMPCHLFSSSCAPNTPLRKSILHFPFPILPSH